MKIKRLFANLSLVLVFVIGIAGCGTNAGIPATPDIEKSFNNGMFEVPNGTTFEEALALSENSSGITAQAVASCSRTTVYGTGGYIAIQTSSTGTVAWGIYLYNKAQEAGPWSVLVYVNGVQKDKKYQNYAPHGSLPKSVAPSGSRFYITAYHISSDGKTTYSGNATCIVP
jgi:hypothetical protein